MSQKSEANDGGASPLAQVGGIPRAKEFANWATQQHGHPSAECGMRLDAPRASTRTATWNRNRDRAMGFPFECFTLSPSIPIRALGTAGRCKYILGLLTTGRVKI
ncbi:hypothetical protein E4U54_005052 [Claviceps lovelessii]|nr:hypothetical protein E4U54_005052 [Claviceps lovelessii]